MKRSVILLLALAAGAVYAEPIKGLDYLGGAKYCDEVLRAHPAGYAAGFFFDTFGNATGCIDRLVATGRVPAVRVQLTWHDNHTYSRDEFDAIARKAMAIDRLAAKYPGTSFYVSGACEHTLSAADAKELMKKVLARCPHCAGYVNVPMNNVMLDTSGGRVFNEVHALGPAPRGAYLYSSDGTDLTQIDAEGVQRKYDGARILFGWAPRFNLSAGGDRLPIEQRTAKPSVEYIRSVERILSPKGAAPAVDHARGLSGRELFKSHAEDMPNGDRRSLHPLFISRTAAKSLQIRATNGSVLGSLRYYGPAPDNGYFRFYIDEALYGYQLAEKAHRASGSNFVVISDGKTTWGPFEPSFRYGYYHP